MVAVYWIFRQWRPAAIDRFFRKGAAALAALYSLGHGGNDAQKTMGIIVALLVAHGSFTQDTQLSLTDFRTAWIILSCHLAMAVGRRWAAGASSKPWDSRLPSFSRGGCCAETAGAATLFMATFLGIPVSTTHTIAGGIIGVGANPPLTGIKWDIAIRIVMAWSSRSPARRSSRR